MPLLTWKSLWLVAFSLSGVASILPTMQVDVYLGGVAAGEATSGSSSRVASPTYTLLASQAFFGSYPGMENANNPTQKLALPPKENPLLCSLSQTVASSIYESNTMVLVPRGGCTFETKAYHAQQLGATAVAVFGTLASRYSLNTTSRGGDHQYTASDIVFPAEFHDYDCSRGRAEIPEAALDFSPLPYNSDMNDPLLMGNASSNLCLSRSPDALSHCSSLACLLTGRRNDSARAEAVLEACCAWDFHIWLYAEGNASATTNRSVRIPAVYLTMSEGSQLLRDLSRYSMVQVVLSARWRPAMDVSSVLIWALGVLVAFAAAYMSASEYRSTALRGRKRQQEMVGTTSRRTEQAPSHPKQETAPSEESLELTAAHAVGFIFMASAALLFLFYFKVYGLVKVLYAIGCSTAISQVFLDPLLRRLLAHFRVTNRVVIKRLLDLENVTFRDVLAHTIGYAIGTVWLYVSFSELHPDELTYYWITQDVFGAAMCITFLRTIRVNSLKVATTLLSAAFFYDIFFVFVSPLFFEKSVMITVATSGGPPAADAVWCEKYPADKACQGGNPLPMLFTIPRILDYQGGSSLLGLGDIVIPGLLLSFAARYDSATFALRLSGRGHDRTNGSMCHEGRRPCSCHATWCQGYFFAATCAYAVGLLMANCAVYIMRMGQPALLYIVPSCLGTILCQSWWRQELHDLWNGPVAIRTADEVLAGRSTRSSDAAIGGIGVQPSLPDEEEDSNVDHTRGDSAPLLRLKGRLENLPHEATMAPHLPTFVVGQRQGMASRHGRTPAFMKRMGLYEKGLLHRAQKEEKIRLIRDQLMSDCTFTPNTTKSQSTRGTQYTTCSQSSHSPVWDRLYPAPSRAKESVVAPPSRPQRRRESLGPAHCHTNDSSTLVSSRSRTTLSTARTGSSMRLEQLYEHGRSKLRSRPLTDRAEAEWRRQRLENEQLQQCTFQPRTSRNGQRQNQARPVRRLQSDAKDLKKTDQRPTRSQLHLADGETTISLATPHPDVRRWTPENAAGRGPRYPSEITVVTRPRTPSFAYSSPPALLHPSGSKQGTGHYGREASAAESRVMSPHSQPPSNLWRTPSPSPPRPPPLPPTRRRFKRENEDFMVDLSSFCENPPPRLLFGESFEAREHRPTLPPPRGGTILPRRTPSAPPPPPPALPSAVPDSASRGSTISTEYGSI